MLVRGLFYAYMRDIWRSLPAYPSHENMKIKVSVEPNGCLKTSIGLSNGKYKNPQELNPLSIIPNFKRASIEEIREECLGMDSGLYEIVSDVPNPFWQAPKPGYGSLGNKKKASRKSCHNLAMRMSAIELCFDAGIFLTLTLPIEDDDAYEALARQSSYAVNRLSQYFRDNFPNDCYARCGAWEYQSRGALHYHLYLGVNEDFWDYFLLSEGAFSMNGCSIFETKKECFLDDLHPSPIAQFPLNAMALFRHRIAKVWEGILDSIGDIYDLKMIDDRYRGRILEYDDLGQRFCNIQIVEKSVAAYLSDYLADSNHKKKQQLRGKFFPVATWFQWDRKATECYQEMSIRDSFEIDDLESLDALLQALFASVELAENTEIIERQNPFYKSHICISAIKGKPLLDMIREWLKDLKILSDARKNKPYLRIRNRQDMMIEDASHQLAFEKFLLKREEIERCRKLAIWDIKNIGQCLFHLSKYCARMLDNEMSKKPSQLSLFEN